MHTSTHSSSSQHALDTHLKPYSCTTFSMHTYNHSSFPSEQFLGTLTLTAVLLYITFLAHPHTIADSPTTPALTTKKMNTLSPSGPPLLPTKSYESQFNIMMERSLTQCTAFLIESLPTYFNKKQTRAARYTCFKFSVSTFKFSVGTFFLV